MEENIKTDRNSLLNEFDSRMDIRIKQRKRKNIAALFEGYNGTYEPTEIDWGKPVGKEVW